MFKSFVAKPRWPLFCDRAEFILTIGFKMVNVCGTKSLLTYAVKVRFSRGEVE